MLCVLCWLPLSINLLYTRVYVEAATAMAALQKDYHVEYGEYSGLHMLGDIAKLTLQVPPQKRAFLLRFVRMRSPPPPLRDVIVYY